VITRLITGPATGTAVVHCGAHLRSRTCATDLNIDPDAAAAP
jgi:hypothetical protein